jgi:uncharacterized protein
VDRSAGPAELTREGCLRLLAAGTVGRIVFTRAAMPAVELVAYVLDGEEVVFHVSPDGALAVATHDAVVGFHVDSVDPKTCAGWSVLGVGNAYEVADPGRRAALPRRGRDAAELVVAVPMQQLSGRRFRLGG